jgi:hypothetical protein
MPYKESAPFSLTFSVRPILALFLSCAFSAATAPAPLSCPGHSSISPRMPIGCRSQFMSADDPR